MPRQSKVKVLQALTQGLTFALYSPNNYAAANVSPRQLAASFIHFRRRQRNGPNRGRGPRRHWSLL